ncbi:MAG: YHS domain-containing (seleno)protein [Hyphomonadaceae bacterium]
MRSVLAVLAFIASFTLAPAAFADHAPVYTAPFSRVAVGGYDVVAYFTDNRAVRGSAQHRITHQGFEYRFASAEHLAAFRANPSRYLPQYGGYCAWAVAQGYTASGDPTNWRIVNGRLYLNYNDEIQRRWEQDIPGHIRRGDANWPSVLSR